MALPVDLAPPVAQSALAIGSLLPIAFPAPYWLMNTLLVAGFYLHLIPMNLALWGGALAAIYLIWGNVAKCDYTKRLGGSMAKSLPLFTSLAITNGIVPLLFLQVLYGPLIYTSSIIMAVPWFGILLLLLVGYYAIYAYVYKNKELGEKAPWLLILSSFLFLIIGFFFSNNMTLMLHPEKFVSMVQGNPNGMSLNLNEPTLIPRFLHFVLGALAVNGLLVGCFGLYQEKRDADYSGWLIQKGAALFLGVTLLQTIVGPWFLFSLPPEVLGQFWGGDKFATATLMGSLGLDVIALIAMAIAAARKNIPAFWVGLVSSLGLLAGMVITRHNLRVFMLEGIYSPATHPAEPQWGVLAIFLGLALAFGLYFVWLGRQVWRSFHPQG